MEIVILTALGVGASTVVGALIGFVIGKSAERLGNFILAFGSGVMLSAAMLGLILPSLEYGNGVLAPITTALGVIMGAVLIIITRRAVPHLESFLGGDREKSDREEQKRRERVAIFVLAIAIHNLPEGIAAGVGFGTGNVGDAVLIALAIALQNIPEGMVIISPMLAVGISRGRAFFYAALTGLIEVVGTLIGYFAIEICTSLLPLALSFAGGCMIEVVCDEMIPEIHSSKKESAAIGMSLIIGYVLMVALGYWI